MRSGKHRRNRGWRYRGAHFDKPLTVAYLIEACKPTPRERLVTLIETTLKKLSFFGFVPDGTDPKTVTATLEIVPSVGDLTEIPCLEYTPPQPFDYVPVTSGSPYTLDALMKMRGKRYGAL